MERIINTVLQALQEGGIDAIRGFSGNELPTLKKPLCAVSMADAVYTPLCADNIITESFAQKSYGLLADAKLLLECYDDYRHGDRACVETAIKAAGICSNLTESFTCGEMELGYVHYEEDYDCFCCNVKIPVRVLIARLDQLV